MFIILIAHIPTNPWADWIPARFGFSDATEIFVFCSGVASALAFGRAFDMAGWRLGAARVLHRIWQVYWAHIGVFVVVVGLLAAVDEAAGNGRSLRNDLNLGPFLDRPAMMLRGYATLSYVPNYFDILPMYLVILALMPIAMALALTGRAAVAAFVAALWLLASFRFLDLPAEPWSDRVWFFNPFSWQLLFFLGFAFGRGWLAPPAPDRRLLILAVAVLALAAPVSCQYGWVCFAGYGAFPVLGDIHQALLSLIDKTHLGVLRIVHFLALAVPRSCWSRSSSNGSRRRLGRAPSRPSARARTPSGPARMSSICRCFSSHDRAEHGAWSPRAMVASVRYAVRWLTPQPRLCRRPFQPCGVARADRERGRCCVTGLVANGLNSRNRSTPQLPCRKRA